ncbi:Transmembrane domain-containing protein [Orpheovirus IHUMI-LCC2]|uniref:Transmembrane domain-containing protein n=1 Tax=Orpheovirus IHUMI-LCC2 TaxID=2023057 RepID=A0A2I2L490_9VIRU|nr:Transmembrane domain-containing protein [Orpheovirus IHUMI-LCC2]SNW62344.1 Transmembrane domain-containing protein [Orpheovirus IHUMI-LCC2]
MSKRNVYVLLFIVTTATVICLSAGIYIVVDYGTEWNLDIQKCKILEVQECILWRERITYKYVVEIPNCGNITLISEPVLTFMKKTTCAEYTSTLINSTVDCVLDGCNIIDRTPKSYIIIPIFIFIACLIFIFGIIDMISECRKLSNKNVENIKDLEVKEEKIKDDMEVVELEMVEVKL